MAGLEGGGAGSPRSHGSQVKPGSQGLFSRGSRKEPKRVIWSRRAETVSADLGLGVCHAIGKWSPVSHSGSLFQLPGLLSHCSGPKMAHVGTTAWGAFTLCSWGLWPLETPSL